MKKLTKLEVEEKIKKIHPQENLCVIKYEGGRKDCEVKCLTCGTSYTKKENVF